ncbi:UDP-N-acetyl-D-mannosamine dehydrogenase [Cellulomonas hominis]|nr:UDP-N-acetyl-D-mannosamine dehydrogenase [Cellulomonas hominis]VTR78295.1 UDP-N-acetyl-D-mannosamine dehydrogenase [Cellulomonas hominis]
MIGLGYVGLPTAVVAATHGADVIGVDVDPRVVDAVNGGLVPFVEPDLGSALAGAVAQGRLRAQRETPAADVYVVAVPTPLRADRTADLGCVDAALGGIAPRLRGGELVVLESTSPPGTTLRLAGRLQAERPDLSVGGDGDDGRPTVHVAYCPERVLPGRVMVELVTNDRVAGGITPEAARRARDVYATFCRGEIALTDSVTAELSKLVENSFRDVNVAFANELSLVAADLDVDVWEVIELANRHPRVDVLRPGPGVGGHCIAVDPWFLVSAAPGRTPLIRAARQVNDAQPGTVVDRVADAVRGVERPRIAALGLAYKADIDDLRESPAVDVVEQLAELLPHALIDVVEPHVDVLPPRLRAAPHVSLRPLRSAVAGADVVLLLVDHAAFRATDPRRLGAADATVIDTRGSWR